MPPLQFFFQLKATSEQIIYAQQLVAYAMEHHTVPNIWDTTEQINRTQELRFTGTLGEIVFADTYGLHRPKRSFGATDGQDYGKDFEMAINGQVKSFDIKTMRRKNNNFYSNYVLNIPAAQLNRADSLTDCYFHLSIHEPKPDIFICSFVGFVNKEDIRNGRVGTFYKKNSARTRGDKTNFRFNANTYEIDFGDFLPAPISEYARQQELFTLKPMKSLESYK
jgi:hypothetical protein